MASVNAGAAEGRGAHALGDTFQQVLQELQSIKEALVAQERRVEERFKELERTMEEDRKVTQATVARANEGAEALRSVFEERLHRIEQRMEVIETRVPSCVGQEGGVASAGEERLTNLESRMERLESSTERALQSVVPRVDALLKQLEKPSPPVTPPHPTPTSASSSTSGASSAPPPPSSASVSSPAPRPRLASAGATAPPPLTRKRMKTLGKQLLLVAADGREADVRKLLDKGANVNFPNAERSTPLMFAAWRSHVKVVNLLLASGANVLARDVRGDTALHFASCKHQGGRCAALLVRAGALVDSGNCTGQTPLHYAAVEGNEGAVRALLVAGASKGVRDNSGRTPVDYAETDNLRRLLRLE